MEEKYISDEEFDALSEEEQVQALIDMVKDAPRDELMLLRKAILEISNKARLTGTKTGN